MRKQGLQRTKSAWSKLSKEWLKSGLTQKEFCVRKGVDYKKFIYWRHKCGQGSPTGDNAQRVTAPKALLPVMVLEHESADLMHSPAEVLPKMGSAISITTPSGHVIQIRDDFKAITLLRLLKTLKDCQ